MVGTNLRSFDTHWQGVEKKTKKKEKKKRKKKKKTLKQVIDELIVIQKRKPVVGSLERKKKIWRKKLVAQKLMWKILEMGTPLMFH
jgi:predicted acetyltransferase